MWRGGFLLLLVLSTFALSPPPKQAHREQPQRQAGQRQAVAPVIKPPSSAPQTKRGTEGCPGSYHPELNCNAITANADVDQARNAENQTWWIRWEVLLTFGTLMVAIFAMIFAKRAATANRDTVAAFVEVERSEVVLTLENFRERPDGEKNKVGGINVTRTWVDFDIIANNLGRSSALITNATGAWFPTKDVPEGTFFTGKNKKYIVKPGGSTVLDLDCRQTVEGLAERSFLWVILRYKGPLQKRERIVRQYFRVLGLRSNVPYTDGKREEADSASEWDYAKHRHVLFEEPGWRGVLGRLLSRIHV